MSTEQITEQIIEQRDFADPDEVRTFEQRPRRDPQGRRHGDRAAGPLAGLALVRARQADRGHRPLRGPPLPVPRRRDPGVRTAEGQEFDATPGQVTSLPAGHDAWVVGDEDVVVVDWFGASHYAEHHA